MEISYIGHSCFKIKGNKATVVIDPYNPETTGYKFPVQSSNVLLTTHNHADHNYIEGVLDYKLLVDCSGEYESNDILVYGYNTFHDNTNGAERGKNTIYEVHIDDFVLLHLGDLGHELSSEILDKLSSVDVLFIPVGGVYTIDAKVASKIINSIEPKYVIPMHYQTPDLKLEPGLKPLEDFFKEMGLDKNFPVEDKLKITIKDNNYEDTTVVVLKPLH